MAALSEAEIDIAFVRLPCESSKAFNLRIIDEEPLVIALPRDNPLSAEPTLALEQLRDVAPILFPREVAPGLYELVFNSCLRAGIDMNRAGQSSQISSSLSMVNAGFGFALVPQSMTCIALPNVSYQSIQGTPVKTDIAIAPAALRAFAHGEAIFGDVLIPGAHSTTQRRYADLFLRWVTRYCATQPPSIFHAAPRTCAAASLHKNSAISPVAAALRIRRKVVFQPATALWPAPGRLPQRYVYRSAAEPAASAPSRGKSRCR